MINNETPICHIGKAAELAGLNVFALRKYEKDGLFNPTRKAQKSKFSITQRLYSINDIEKLKLIKRIGKKYNIEGRRFILALQKILADAEIDRQEDSVTLEKIRELMKEI